MSIYKEAIVERAGNNSVTLFVESDLDILPTGVELTLDFWQTLPPGRVKDFLLQPFPLLETAAETSRNLYHTMAQAGLNVVINGCGNANGPYGELPLGAFWVVVPSPYPDSGYAKLVVANMGGSGGAYCNLTIGLAYSASE